MTEDVWSAQDTTPDDIESALREMLRERHAANQALAPARVLNFVVVVDRDWKGEISNRLQRLGRYNPSRTVLCAVEEGRQKLDARAVMRYEEPADGAGLGVMLEEVEIDLGPEQLERLDTVIDPVIVSELPTMLWSPHGYDEAVRVALDLVDVILLDSDDLADPPEAFARATELLRCVLALAGPWTRRPACARAAQRPRLEGSRGLPWRGWNPWGGRAASAVARPDVRAGARGGTETERLSVRLDVLADPAATCAE